MGGFCVVVGHGGGVVHSIGGGHVVVEGSQRGVVGHVGGHVHWPKIQHVKHAHIMWYKISSELFIHAIVINDESK